MPVTPETFANNVSTTIAGGAGGAGSALNAADTTLILPSGVGAELPSAGPCRLLFGDLTTTYEIATYASRSGDTLSGLVRGLEGTTALTWAFGTPVQQVATAGSFSSLWGALSGLSLVYNVKDSAYGAKGDGVTDDTAAIAAALSAANAAGGGKVYFPAGTYISGAQTLYSYVHLEGAGKGATVIKLKNAANADLFSAFAANINLNGTGGSGPSWNGSAIIDFSLRHLTLDGNYANQSSGPSYPLRFYGLAYVLEHLEVRNGYSGGILADYYGPYPSSGSGAAGASNPWMYEATWHDVEAHHSLGITTAIGIEKGGPTDSRFTNVLSYHNNSHSFHSAPNNGGLQAAACHMWQSGLADANSCCWLQESSLYATGCEAEGDPHAQFVALNTEIVWNGGAIFAGNAAGLGLQIGQAAGGTPYTNSARQSAGVATAFQPFGYVFKGVLWHDITHASGHIQFVNDGGDGVVDGVLVASVGTATIYSGTPAGTTQINLTTHGFTDARKQIIKTKAQQSWGQPSAVDPGTGGTITTAGVTVAIVNPAAAETGIILQAGTDPGQLLAVINLAAFTLTMAASGTSHVATGTSDVIAATSTALYLWESGFNFWYRVK